MRRLPLLLLTCLWFLPAGAAETPRHEVGRNLTVLTDSGLMRPLAKITRRYSISTGTPITVVVKKPEEIAQQIEEGLEAHVLITADSTLLGNLSERGLVDVTSRQTVARTGLALITTTERMARLGIAKRISFASVIGATGDTPILTSTPDTLEGARAAALTEGQPFSETLSARLTELNNDDEVLAGLRDEQALGLLLATQAVGEPDIAIISLLPGEISPAVHFDAVVIGGELSEEARAFTHYLGGNEAASIFTRFGYQPAL